ncbi:MAG: murein biosynthesis integral membrane protein MurJ [Gammaproteobacteria bacterium]|nr:murein biosynthesis integral membrane protein MurJ [Gammaproteobacteria bacterium]
MTLISRILGLVRDIVFARFFGAGLATDAFFVAFKIPNFMRRLFAEGAFSQGFIPVLSEYKVQREHDEVRELISRVMGTLGLILLVLTGLGLLLLPPLFDWLGLNWFSGEEERKFLLAGDLIRWTFPYIFFISLTALVSGVLNTYQIFALPAFAPVLLNIVLIGATLGFAHQFEQPVTSIAIGVFVAGVVQLLFLLPALYRLRLLVVPLWGWAHDGVRRIVKLMVPAIFGASVVQINLMIDTAIAFLLVSGSVSWLYYSDRLVEFPLGIFGIALSTVLLPGLSKRFASNAAEDFSRMMDWGLRLALLISIPAATGLFFLSGPLIATLFGYDAFTPHSIQMSSMSLMAYAVGLPAFIFVKVLAPGFFARQDTRSPVKAAVVAMIANVSLNILFVVSLLMIDFDGVHTGLALATSLGAYVNIGLLLYWLLKADVYRPLQGWPGYFMQVMLASGVMALILWWFSGDIDLWIARAFMQRLFWLLLWVFTGAGIFGIVLLLLGVRPTQLLRPTQHNQE